MKGRWMLVFLLLTGSLLSAAQPYKVKIRLSYLPSSSNQPLYLAGSFNGWNPAAAAYQFTRQHTLQLQLSAGRYEAKVTRGSWNASEADSSGHPAGNHTFDIHSDTVISWPVPAWTDAFVQPQKRHTASAGVYIIDTAFYIPQLQRYRTVRIYLPAGYTASKKRYGVLYMHDGQNLFDEATSGFGEWGVDEALDTLGTAAGETIVVGIDHGGDKRLNEYSPFDMKQHGKGEGDAYVDFIVKTLRPYINKHYRTRRNFHHTAIAGSSMGGLISLYAILKYPKVFGTAGIFSPAFWIAPDLKTIITRRGRKVKSRLYFYCGGAESERMTPDMLAVFNQLHNLTKAKMQTVIRSQNGHNEAAWRAEFPPFYWFLKR